MRTSIRCKKQNPIHTKIEHHQTRGTQEYELSEDSSFVKRDNRVFWLSEEAKETVREAVALFERECAELLEGSHVSCRITSTGLMLHYVEKMFSRYYLLFIRNAPEGKIRVRVTASRMAFKFWALQYLEHVEVLMPRQLRTDILKSLQDGVNKYSEE